MSQSRTQKWTLPIVATAALFLAFGLYMSFAVPLLEGKSAAQIPKIDPLGIFKSESAGQWISLFDANSWQRDEENRNIIKADGNILVFQDYFQQDDGTLKVTRLCLLLFDDASKDANGNVDLDGKHYPTIVEAVDGAVLTFDQSRPMAMDKYGELEQIEFLGQVQFWKESTDPTKVLFLQTHKLVVNGIKAATHFPVQFRFGDSIGRAVGLDLRFENPEMEKTLHPPVTGITGIDLVRFGNLQHVELKMQQLDGENKATTAAKSPREIELQCSGPAEFYFKDLYANFHTNVEIYDRETGYQLNGNLVQLLFAADATTELTNTQQLTTQQQDSQQNDQPENKSSFLPKGMKPRQFIAQGDPQSGTPAVVHHAKDNTDLQAAQLKYDLVTEQFAALASIPNSPSSAFPKQVRLTANGMELLVPELKYRSAADGDDDSNLLGEIWATGAGRLTHRQTNKQIEMTWQDQLTLTDDKELPDHKVFSVYGDAKVRIDQGAQFDADQFHFWVKAQNETTLFADGDKPKTQLIPDLLVAQGNVRFDDKKMVGEVNDARIYFPKNAKPLSTSLTKKQKRQLRNSVAKSVANDLIRLARPVFPIHPASPIMPQPVATLPLDKDKKKFNAAFVKAESLIMTLQNSRNTDANAAYEPAEIQLLKNVKVTECKIANHRPVPLQPPGFDIQGQKVTAVLQGHDLKDQPLYAWQIDGDQTTAASIQSPQITMVSRTLNFDQANHRIWAPTAGSMEFPLDKSTKLLGTTSNDQGPKVSTKKGHGSLQWQDSMSFDGQLFRADGQVQCFIDQTMSDQSRQKVQASSQHIDIKLSSPVRFSDQTSSRPPQLHSLQFKSEDQRSNPVRVYQQEFDSDGTLVGQEAAWAPAIVINKQEEKIDLTGQGHLWSVRMNKKKKSEIALVGHAEDEKKSGQLDHLQIQFDRGLQGDIKSGKFVFSGPVHTVYGTSNQWQVKNAMNDLLDPVQLDCDQLTMNRWQISEGDQFEMELDASGSVHIVGQQFESLAERLKYNRNQDLLTIEGDTRTAAKFWQDNPQTGKRNQIMAQKIWYRPSSKWFNCEGFKGGDITFFAGQK